MEKKQEIFESRKRLDNALSSPDLVNEDSIAYLVKEKLFQSSLRSNRDAGKVVDNRTMEVTNFLEMLRSASGVNNSHSKLHNDWKVKQDTDQLRVMYREGLHSSPFHTLLAEGFADGPMDVCLCVSWESTLYKKWWPQYSVPTFKIIASSCLQKVRIGEEISLIRMKVPWPVSDREAVLHYFEIEYFKEDLILVLIKTISDTEHIDADIHGFSRDGIPLAKDTIRIDMVGGFVLQKVEGDRCYFRAIFNFDIKLEFLPPSLINFISRQLIGNGHKLYQKAVGSVATSDEDYRKALQGPLYVWIRQHLYTRNRPETSLEGLDKEKLTFILDEHNADSPVKDHVIKTTSSVPEITEADTEQRPDAEGKNHNLVFNKQWISSKEKASISPEVEHSLKILDEVISMVRGQSACGQNCCKSSSVGDDFPISELLAKASISNNADVPESSNKLKSTNKPEGSPHTDDHSKSNISFSIIEEAGHNHEARNSQVVESRINFHENLPSKASVRVMQHPTLDSISKACDEESSTVNGFHNSSGPYSGKTKKRRKKLSLCCLSPSFLHD